MHSFLDYSCGETYFCLSSGINCWDICFHVRHSEMETMSSIFVPIFPFRYLQISTTSTVLIFDHTITSTTKHYLQKYIFYCTSISILYIYFSILKSLLVVTQLSSCWRVLVYWSIHILVLTSLISLVQTYHCVGKS